MLNVKREELLALPKNPANYIVLKEYILQHQDDFEAYKVLVEKYCLEIPACDFAEIFTPGKIVLSDEELQEIAGIILFEEAIKLMHNKVIVLSGFSGAGKGTISNAILRRRSDIRPVKSVTTRKPRNTDDFYYFLDEVTFRALKEKGLFLESNEYNGSLYATPKSELTNILGIKNKNALLEIDSTGFSEILKNEMIPKENLRSIFIVTKDAKTLYNRLKNRNTESGQEITRRLQTALKECEKIHLYDAVVINENLEEATNDVLAFIDNGSVSSRQFFDCERFKKDLKKIIENLEASDKRKN